MVIVYDHGYGNEYVDEVAAPSGEFENNVGDNYFSDDGEYEASVDDNEVFMMMNMRMILMTMMFQHHQKEIFSAILTEYTDWASVSRWISSSSSYDDDQCQYHHHHLKHYLRIIIIFIIIIIMKSISQGTQLQRETQLWALSVTVFMCHLP